MAQQRGYAEAKDDAGFPGRSSLPRLADLALTYLPATLALAVQIVLLMVAYKHVTYVNAAQARLTVTPVNAAGPDAHTGTQLASSPPADETAETAKPEEAARPTESLRPTKPPAPEPVVLITQNEFHVIRQLVSALKDQPKLPSIPPSRSSFLPYTWFTPPIDENQPPSPRSLDILVTSSAGLADKWQERLVGLLPREVNLRVESLADEKPPTPAAGNERRRSESASHTAPSPATPAPAQTRPSAHSRVLVVIGPLEGKKAPPVTRLSNYETVDALLMSDPASADMAWCSFCASKGGAVFLVPKDLDSNWMDAILRRILNEFHPAVR